MKRTRAQILDDVQRLMIMYQQGRLGGEQMPEDVHPDLPPAGKDLCHYFTLPMALNYQRNSYALWRGATAAFHDPDTAMIYDPLAVVAMDDDGLWSKLAKHKVGLQSSRHTAIWRTICTTLAHHFDGDIRQLFKAYQFDIAKVLEAVYGPHKKGLPYLSGPKISNYWLYVISSYTQVGLVNRAALSIAPDTHVIQASVRLGLIDDKTIEPLEVAARWKELLQESGFDPIDIHTPLWLWSRGEFKSLHQEAA